MVGEHGFAARPPVGVGWASAASRAVRARTLSSSTMALVGASSRVSRPASLVGQPRLERHVGGGFVGADVHAAVVDVEADARRVPGTQRQ